MNIKQKTHHSGEGNAKGKIQSLKGRELGECILPIQQIRSWIKIQDQLLRATNHHQQ